MNVLIVDDDKLARKGLIAVIDWEQYGLCVVAMCKMGKKRWSFWKIIRWIWFLQILICRR